MVLQITILPLVVEFLEIPMLSFYVDLLKILVCYLLTWMSFVEL
jgi:hypothetical protein